MFEFKNEEYFAIGLRNGSVRVKVGDQIMSNNNWAVIKPPTTNRDDKVT
jgi:hypothetical protein